MSPKELIQNLINLQNGYANVPRAIITSERLKYAHAMMAKKIDVEDTMLREPLLEHVGHLPIIASFLHPHIEHTKEVDLGRVLIMLSIHDIGETVLGDVISYSKNADQTEEENQIVQKLLPKQLLSYFEEFEERKSFDAKYAKSVDSMAPFLHEIEKPKLTLQRFAFWNLDSKKIETKKRELFEWDSVLKQMFEVYLDAFHAIERGEPTGFTSSSFDLA